MSKLPHFPFYPDDWLSSQKVMIEFDDAERGIYITLLAIAWHYPDCTLPSDIEKCRLLCRAKRKVKVEKVLRTCWELTENGWRNDRELNENRHARDKHRKAVLSGKCSANKRLASTNAERTVSERSTNQNQNQNQNQNHIKDKVKNTAKKPKPAPNPEIRVVVDFFYDQYKTKFGNPPMIDKKDAALVSVRLRQFTVDGLKEAIVYFLSSPKAKEHPTLAVALSAHSLNLFEQRNPV